MPKRDECRKRMNEHGREKEEGAEILEVRRIKRGVNPRHLPSPYMHHELSFIGYKSLEQSMPIASPFITEKREVRNGPRSRLTSRGTDR